MITSFASVVRVVAVEVEAEEGEGEEEEEEEEEGEDASEGSATGSLVMSMALICDSCQLIFLPYPSPPSFSPSRPLSPFSMDINDSSRHIRDKCTSPCYLEDVVREHCTVCLHGYQFSVKHFSNFKFYLNSIFLILKI